MVGDLLRAEREKQNLTVKDIESGTSIRALYIESIEKGEYNALPGEVYVKGFIRNYASYLKMDADAVLKQYNEERHPEQVAVQAEAASVKQPAVESNKTAVPRVEPKKETVSSDGDFMLRVEKSRRSQNLVLGAAAAVVIFGGAYFLFGGGDDKAAPAKPAQQASTQTTKSVATETPKPEEKKFEDVEIAAKFSDRCWTKVVVDGKTAFEGTAEKGKTMHWTGKEKVLVTAGNAGAVELTYNGQDLGKAGEVGEVIEKSFTKDKAEDVK